MLLVVIGYRKKAGFHRPGLGRFWASRQLLTLRIFAKRSWSTRRPARNSTGGGPTPEALLALGLRSYSDIPELKELERYFDSTKSFGNDNEREANLEPLLEKAKTSQARRRRRELERRSSVPRGLEPASRPENE